MTTARTFLRFVLAGVMVNMLAAACIVNSEGGDGDDDGSCEPNTYKDCTCTDGTESERKCNASGTAWGNCACDGGGVGGGGNEGGDGPAPVQGGDGNTAGATNTTYGGETSSTGGVPGGDGGTPNTPAEGGAGGAGPVVEPGLCDEDPNDTCADCYQQGCCDQWTACVDDNDCLTEFTSIIACAEVIREDHNVSTAEFEQCAADESAASGGWSNGLSPLTIDMVNCVAGEDEGGWEGSPWGTFACKAGCFDAQ